MGSLAPLNMPPINPSDLYGLADQLEADPSYVNEVTDRAIIGRAYYASYHTAMNIIEEYALPESTSVLGGSHQKNLNRLIECNSSARATNFRTIQSIGYIVSRTLNPHRTAADYHLDQPLPRNSKEETLARTAVVLEQAKLVIPKP